MTKVITGGEFFNSDSNLIISKRGGETMKKVIIPIIIILLVVIVFGTYIFINQTQKNNQITKDVILVNTPVINISPTITISLDKPEDVVKKVDLAYWQASKYNDYAAAYDFFTPNDKQLITKENYVKREKADPSLAVISDIKIEDVRVEGDTAYLRVSVIANTGTWPGTDTYKLIDGKWYRVMSEDNKEFLGIK